MNHLENLVKLMSYFSYLVEGSMNSTDTSKSAAGNAKKPGDFPGESNDILAIYGDEGYYFKSAEPLLQKRVRLKIEGT